MEKKFHLVHEKKIRVVKNFHLVHEKKVQGGKKSQYTPQFSWENNFPLLKMIFSCHIKGAFEEQE